MKTTKLHEHHKTNPCETMVPQQELSANAATSIAVAPS